MPPSDPTTNALPVASPATVPSRAPLTAAELAMVLPDPLALSMIPRVVAERFRLVPLQRQGDALVVAMVDTGDVYTIDEVARMAGCRVVPVAADPTDIQNSISRLYTAAQQAQEEDPQAIQHDPRSPSRTRRVPESVIRLGHFTPGADAPAVLMLDQILQEGIENRASDIHIEPHEQDLFIRYRVDGMLTDALNIDPDLHAPIVSRIKVLSNIDIAEQRLPLDGRFTIDHRRQRFDVRVSTVPGVFGEKAVLRLLAKDTSGFSLETLGLQEREMQLFQGLIAKPYGMILVTGPTGAGKSTTLYSTLRRVDCVGKNVITIEDPVEYELPRVTQIQVHPRIGLTFATALRHVLRQDPDILMVGEIRDQETLEMAVQSALTGHLVLSTLHCNDAAAAPPRCIDMGLEPFLFTSSVIGVVAQRLVRKVCQHCKNLEPLPPAVRERFGVRDPRAAYYRGRGCPQCRQTGYRGRVGIFEVMIMNDAVREAVHERASAPEIRRIALQHGMVSLQGDAIRKVQLGLTTPEEVLRAVWMEGA